jgi:hypothetical protein
MYAYCMVCILTSYGRCSTCTTEDSIHQTSIIVLAQQSDSISTLNLKYSRLVKLRTVDGSAVEAGVWTGYHHHLSDLGMIHNYGVNPIRFGQMLAEDTTYIAYEDTRNAQERR